MKLEERREDEVKKIENIESNLNINQSHMRTAYNGGINTQPTIQFLSSGTLPNTMVDHFLLGLTHF